MRTSLFVRPTLIGFLLASSVLAQSASSSLSGPDDAAVQRAIQPAFAPRALAKLPTPDPKDAHAALARLLEFDRAVRESTTKDRRGRAQEPERAALEAIVPLDQRAADLRIVVKAYLSHVDDAEPDAFCARVDSLRDEHGFTSQGAIRKDRDFVALALLAIDTRRTQELPPTRLSAHPAAARFPGAVPEEAPRVERAVSLDPRRARWQSTGLYAPPGEPITVNLAEMADGAAVEIIVGCHTDDVLRRPQLNRVPRIVRRFRLEQDGEHVVGNAFGGLIHVVGHGFDATSGGRLSLTMRGAVDAPRFVLGETTAEAWRASIRARSAPFGELEGRRLILSLPSAVLAGVDDPVAVCEFWDRVVEVQDDLACFERESPERFVFDRQISAGYMHSGYPLMGPVSAAPNAVDLARLRDAGSWGMFHEIGHNHQTVHFGRYANPWTFDGNTEVTVNIFSSWTYVAALQRPERMGHQHWRQDLLSESLHAEFTSAPYAEKSHRERCLFWVHLIAEIGWDELREVFHTYATMPRAEWPQDDLDKRSRLLEIVSQRTGRSFAPMFAAWGLQTTDAARAAVADLPPVEPKVSLPDR